MGFLLKDSYYKAPITGHLLQDFYKRMQFWSQTRHYWEEDVLARASASFLKAAACDIFPVWEAKSA